MSYRTEDLKQKAISAIKDNNLFFLADVYAYLGISHDTYHRHFPTGSEDSEEIKECIERNKARTKVSIRAKLHKSESPAALLGLYKLLATDEERRALAMEYRDHTTGGEKINKVEVELVSSKDQSG